MHNYRNINIKVELSPKIISSQFRKGIKLYTKQMKGSRNFVYFNPNTCSILEHQHYNIGIDMQSTCSMPSVGTMGIMLPQKEYLLESLNV